MSFNVIYLTTYILYIFLSLWSRLRLICSSVSNVLGLFFSDDATNYKAFLCLAKFGKLSRPKKKTGYDFALISTVKSIIIQLLFTTNSMESQLNTHKHIFICIFLFFFFLFFVLGWVEFQLVFFARHSTRKLILESIARQLRLRSHDRYELDLLLLFVYLVVGVVCLFFFSLLLFLFLRKGIWN